MRSEPHTFVFADNATVSQPINANDLIHKTVEVSGLTSGNIKIELFVAVSWTVVNTITADGVFHVDEMATKIRVDKTAGVGDNLRIDLLSLNTRAE